MSLPDDEAARDDVRRAFANLFERAERVHNAAVEVLTRGTFSISKPEGHNFGVLTLIASLLTKACKTFRAIQIVCDGGLGQDAAVLARQLFETTVGVTFILQKDSIVRASMFAAHEDQRRLVLVSEVKTIKGLEHIGSDDAISKAEAKVRAWDGHPARSRRIGPKALVRSLASMGRQRGWSRVGVRNDVPLYVSVRARQRRQ